MRKFLFALWLTMGMWNAPSYGVEVVLDFESLAHGGSSAITIATYVQDGFEVTAIDPFHPGAADLSVWGTQSNGFNGSTALFATVSGSPITLLRRSDNGVFDLTSIDLGPALANAGTGATVTFTGSRADGSVVTEGFTFAGNLMPPTAFPILSTNEIGGHMNTQLPAALSVRGQTMSRWACRQDDTLALGRARG